MLVGWELVGLCSFVLIGHWWEEKPNSDAALKAFLTTRTGDIGLIVIVIAVLRRRRRSTSSEINEAAPSARWPTTWCCWWPRLPAPRRSSARAAQFPLHTWLPDAMAGPTPVSALIHAATMVVAGVYLVARLYGVFCEGFSIGDGGINAMAVIGGVTIAHRGAAGVRPERHQEGARLLDRQPARLHGDGARAWGLDGGVFHLFTHAFFKALLFLGAGSVSHAVHTFDMKKMGGLRKYMPITFWTFVIGSLALAGIFPLAGFWSKDEILARRRPERLRGVHARRASSARS